MGRRDPLIAEERVAERTTGPRPLPPSFHERVRGRLRSRADRAELDGLLLLTPGNVRYATGWHFSVNERPVGLWIPVDGAPLLLVPLLELENALAIPGVEVRTYEEYPGEEPPVRWMVQQTGARSLAADALPARELHGVEELLDRLELVDHTRPERSVKAPEELVLIREAARFADMALERLLANGGSIVSRGGTEVELLADCIDHAREALVTAHGEAFAGTKLGITASVHSGPRAALPHGSVTSRVPEPGEPVVAGIGCSLGGYHAESGATLVVGEPSADQLAVMRAMSAAAAATRTMLAERATCAEVNEAALTRIHEAGFGAAIRHRIGHGMGVEGHEAPWLAPGDDTPVASGMVFSCEPGIYRPEVDGWRTIDTLIVADDRVEVASRFLTRHPPETRILPT